MRKSMSAYNPSLRIEGICPEGKAAKISNEYGTGKGTGKRLDGSARVDPPVRASDDLEV